MKHAVLGVIAGYLVWTALWLGGNAMFFGAAAEAIEAGEAYAEAGPLVGVIGLSVVCSLVAGVVTALLSKERAAKAAAIMGLLLLATGIVVQAGVWSLMPVWYHLTFLMLLMPISLAGSALVPKR